MGSGMQLKWRLSHAQGYLQLGMVDEAAAELMQGVKQRQAATRRFNQISTKVAGVAATALAPP